MSININDINDFDIAIIGISGRFPGARNKDEFWKNLVNGVDSINRLNYTQEHKSGNFVGAYGVLDDIEYFDASFFDINDREAERMDFQQRFLLECVHEALEDAGYVSDKVNGPIGLFAGSDDFYYVWEDYFKSTEEDFFLIDYVRRRLYLESSLVAKISYKLNLQGPSLAIRAACATSLVAVHLGCQSLLNYESDLALAGGVNIIYPFQEKNGYFAIEGAVSRDGYTRAFDADCDGFVPGNGVGVVVLKRLREAIEDHDYIYGVIKGSAVNNDGDRKVGYAAPSIQGEASVVKSALAIADVKPQDISYIETHGTATKLGDAVEIEALKQAFNMGEVDKPFCAIGSVKTNVGHLNIAAGIAGVIKTTLSLNNRKIPPSLYFNNVNPELNIEKSPFYVNSRLSEWKANGKPRRAGISSFAVGGTNAHIVMEEAPEFRDDTISNQPNILLLSAKTPSAEKKIADDLAKYINQNPDKSLQDVAYTLQVGRKPYKYRRFEVCSTAEDALARLQNEKSRNRYCLEELSRKDVVFMFPGAGSQYAQMGLEMYKSNDVFRREMDKCFKIINELTGNDLKEKMYLWDYEKKSKLIKAPIYTLLLTFSVSYSLAQMWIELGVKPAYMVGHSAGEYVAACISGVYTLEDALYIISERAKLFESLKEGAMISISITEDELIPLLIDGISITAINSKKRILVSGMQDKIKEFTEVLSRNRIPFMMLESNRAAHSSLLDSILKPFEESFENVKFGEISIPIVSTYTGDWLRNNEMCNSEYWVKQMRYPVRFADALSVLLESDNIILLEVGPGQQLTKLARSQIKRRSTQVAISSFDNGQERTDEWNSVLQAMGQLWIRGIDISWEKTYGERKPFRVPLPTYPFERKKYWRESKFKNKGNKPAPYVELEIEDECKIESDISQSITQDNEIRNDTDKKLMGIFTDVLGIRKISIYDSFYEYGFDSLTAVLLISRLKKSFYIDISIKELYKFSTIEEVSDYLSKLKIEDLDKDKSEITTIKRGEKSLEDLFNDLE
ncbi:beta-ketoacyl synthase N-terminal-like domain-containing protein [Wukongibacter sp. M2B1]|uniref:type I polyketide synthase n=1 Tax=Wukongibacter sp. M2B1 TaxID=3088895 RepID=UPI003D7BDAE9